MEIIKKHLTNGQYLTHAYEKKSLFLHHTAGPTAEGAWRWWNETPERVGTPYIVDRNGTIVECFDPKVWAYHLGIVGDDNYHEMFSVNIEIVSCGRLYKENGKFLFYPLYPNKMYPREIPQDEVFVLDKPWKGHTIYHKYSDKQIEALRELIPFIVKNFPGIYFPAPLGQFFEFNQDVVDKHLSGLWSHSTVRADKDDIFPYPPLLEMLEEVATTLFGSDEKPKSVPKTKKNKA